MEDVWTRAFAAGTASVEHLLSLAFEIGALDDAAGAIDRALTVWPDHRAFYPMGAKIALARHDQERARRLAAAWTSRFPDDPQARDLARVTGR